MWNTDVVLPFFNTAVFIPAILIVFKVLQKCILRHKDSCVGHVLRAVWSVGANSRKYCSLFPLRVGLKLAALAKLSHPYHKICIIAMVPFCVLCTVTSRHENSVSPLLGAVIEDAGHKLVSSPIPEQLSVVVAERNRLSEIVNDAK